MKKLIALLLALTLALSCVSALADTYFGNSVYAEAGYENDCYNGVARVLNLYDDGTFQLVDNTSIIQVSYIVVTNWAYIVTGTYEVTSDEDGVKEVVLHGDNVTYIMNGSVTTSEEDAELLEDYEEITFECDSESFSLKEI
ncbi:MAG: hypothetical protein IJ229_12695 [Clostridia bacterium]|nr:hypothetical protein [Clostridia bacterium]MBR1685707.1 hypothetical protein [Clostridia bacterium]MBR2287159.1 hypothetical protein [Clostridia bacterium]